MSGTMQPHQRVPALSRVHHQPMLGFRVTTGSETAPEEVQYRKGGWKPILAFLVCFAVFETDTHRHTHQHRPRPDTPGIVPFLR